MSTSLEVGTKQCARCKALKPVAEFGKRSCNSDGLDTNCRVCRRASDRIIDRRRRQKVRDERADEGSTANHPMLPELACFDCGKPTVLTRQGHEARYTCTACRFVLRMEWRVGQWLPTWADRSGPNPGRKASDGVPPKEVARRMVVLRQFSQARGIIQGSGTRDAEPRYAPRVHKVDVRDGAGQPYQPRDY